MGSDDGVGHREQGEIAPHAAVIGESHREPGSARPIVFSPRDGAGDDDRGRADRPCDPTPLHAATVAGIGPVADRACRAGRAPRPARARTSTDEPIPALTLPPALLA